MKPKFEFHSNSIAPNDRSGMAVWRYDSPNGTTEVIVRQPFDTFAAAYEMNVLIEAAWRDGEAEGYAKCERNVLEALKRG